MKVESKDAKIYWEKQGQDKLCGVHCLNSLLQGPYCNEIELSTQALELDRQEKELMGQGGFTNDYQKYLKEESNNVAEDGNFSYQVLAEALKKLGDIYMESVDSQINQQQDLSNEMGFICNSSSHWFPIRKIDGIWYNLNSTNRGGPEIISDFYLSAFLQSIKEGGYTIFVVKGVYPYQEDPQEFFGEFAKHQKWFSKAQVQAVHQKRLKKKNYKLNIGGTDEREYDEAIKRSLGKQPQKNNEDSADEEDWEKIENPDQWQPEKQQNIAFSGTGIQIQQGGSAKSVNYYKFDLNSNEDPELAFALKLSIEAKFQEKTTSGSNIAFAMPEGKIIQWQFPNDSLVEDLYDYVLINLPQGKSYNFLLQFNFPKQVLNDVTLTLEQAGLEDMTLIDVAQQ